MLAESRAVSYQAYLDHLDMATLLSGCCESLYVPMSQDAKRYLEQLALVARDCEEAFQGFILYLSVIKGKRCRATKCQRHLILQIAGLVHQFKKEEAIRISLRSLAPTKKKQASLFIRTLEKAGCLELVDGYWESHKYRRDHNKCRSFKVVPAFRSLLNAILASTRRYQELGTFAGPKLLAPSSKNSTLGALISYISYGSRNIEDTCSLGALSRQRRPRASSRQFEAFKEVNGKRRAARLARLWSLHTRKELEQSFPMDKAIFNCHSAGIGPEWSDADVVYAVKLRYHYGSFLKLTRKNDEFLPIGYQTCVNIKVDRDKNGNVTSISCRPTNKLCGTYNEEHKANALREKQLPREDVVVSLLGSYHHFDVKCSIYNTIHALRTGYFTPFYDYYGPASREFALQRNEIKVPFMAVNFGIFAELAKKHRGKRAEAQVYAKGPNGKKHPLPLSYGELQDWMESSGLEVQGRCTDVFWHEAYIYELARAILFEEYSIRSVRVYDSFYTDEEVSRAQWCHVLNKALGQYRHLLHGTPL